MRIRSRWLINRDFQVLENASIEIKKAPDQEIDLGHSILMPGLVNAHCHFDYTNMRGMIPQKAHFTEWIQEINKLKMQWKDDDFRKSIQAGIAESLSFGTTFVANWTCSPSWVPSPEKQKEPSRILWLWELISLRQSPSMKQWNDWAHQINQGSPIWSPGLAPHAPYTCSRDVTADAAKWSRDRHVGWSIHVSESEEEYQMFHDASGKLFEFLKSLGRQLDDCGRGQSEYDGIFSAVSNGSGHVGILLAHANHTGDEDLQRLKEMQQNGLRIGVVHCPRSHAYFRRNPFPFQKYVEAGIPVCLGTDSLASCENLSMFEEMRLFKKSHPEVSSKDVFFMSTIAGLPGLGLEKEWPGWEDWIAIPKENAEGDLWDNITNFTGSPSFVMVNGHILKNETA